LHRPDQGRPRWHRVAHILQDLRHGRHPRWLHDLVTGKGSDNSEHDHVADYVDWTRVSMGKLEDVEPFCKALPEILMVTPAGLEPATVGLEVRCSIQLS
jgi:hypothetical protein